MIDRTRPSPQRLRTLLLGALSLALAVGWVSRERAFANEAARVKSATIVVDDVPMSPHSDAGKVVGQAGLYFQGDTDESTKFVTGRFVLDAKQSPHAPHTHPEEEVMIIESGRGVIVVDGKKTEIGPGSAMYTAPNVPHGIENTGDTPIVFYFIKWAPKASK